MLRMTLSHAEWIILIFDIWYLVLIRQEYLLLSAVVLVILIYFLIATPVMNDDGYHYEGFAESLARGVVDFKSFYGFHGLSILSVPTFWLTGSNISIIYTSMILVLLSTPLMYLTAKGMFNSRRAGIYGLIIFLLTPYPYTTLMRGFQEGALLFFILLIIYASMHKKVWIPLVWAFGGIVKPFALVLAPLFLLPTSQVGNGKTVDNRQSSPGVGDAPLRELAMSVIWISRKRVIWLIVAFIIGGLYLGASYYQTGHLVNNAAINSYQGNFNTGNPPPLVESFTIGIKGPLRIGANLLLAYRKIMVSPFLILVGLWVLWKDKTFKYRNNFIWAIILNFLLLSFMTFSFSKYLLPATTLISFAAIPFIMKHRWAMLIFLADSVTVFLPIWNFFGHEYWPNVWVYLTPLWLAVIIFVFVEIKNQRLNINFDI